MCQWAAPVTRYDILAVHEYNEREPNTLVTEAALMMMARLGSKLSRYSGKMKHHVYAGQRSDGRAGGSSNNAHGWYGEKVLQIPT